MRRLIFTGSVLAAATLSACAPNTTPSPTYGERLRTLSASCEARGGILTPRPGTLTGRPETDNVCRISGASRIERDRS